MSIGTLFGGLYGLFWILEETGALEDNPMEEFWNGYVLEWVTTATKLDIVRVPLIYFEYQITLLLGKQEFDPTNTEFQWLFFMISFPFIWTFMFLLNPFIAILSPFIMGSYYYDPTLFEFDAKIFKD